MCDFQYLIIISSFISAFAMGVVAVYTYRQHKIHYDSDLTGFVKEFKSGQGPFKLECFLVNSGGVPITIKNISYNLEDSQKSELIYCDKEEEFDILTDQGSLNRHKLPLSIKGEDATILVFTFYFRDLNGHIILLPDRYKRVDKIKIKFDYSVYKNSKEFFLTHTIK